PLWRNAPASRESARADPASITRRRTKSSRYLVKIPLWPRTTSSDARTTQKGLCGSIGFRHVSCARPKGTDAPGVEGPPLASPRRSETSTAASLESIGSSESSQEQRGETAPNVWARGRPPKLGSADVRR